MLALVSNVFSNVKFNVHKVYCSYRKSARQYSLSVGSVYDIENMVPNTVLFIHDKGVEYSGTQTGKTGLYLQTVTMN
ncbi:MAG: hypothetical protein HQL07_06135 [Nitrospirae bacterium]|nr:hypothetical protein [Magnetococcales bacterium]